jgi:hypothetical protein
MPFNFLSIIYQKLKNNFIKKEEKLLLTPRNSDTIQSNFIIIKK